MRWSRETESLKVWWKNNFYNKNFIIEQYQDYAIEELDELLVDNEVDIALKNIKDVSPGIFKILKNMCKIYNLYEIKLFVAYANNLIEEYLHAADMYTHTDMSKYMMDRINSSSDDFHKSQKQPK